MTDFDRTNRGSIWKNEKKTTDGHPDFTGSYTSESGIEFWVSAWKRKDGANPKAPALTFSMKPKDATKRADPISSGRHLPPKKSIIPDDDMDEEIPF